MLNFYPSDRDTGYRYYSVKQLTQLDRILALKDLGLSLEQVKRLVKEEISPKEIRGMLVLKKAQIEVLETNKDSTYFGELIFSKPYCDPYF